MQSLMQPRKKKQKKRTQRELYRNMGDDGSWKAVKVVIWDNFFLAFSSLHRVHAGMLLWWTLNSALQLCTRVEAHLALVMFGPHSILKKEDGKNKKTKKQNTAFTSQESDFGFGLSLRVNERTLSDSSPPTIGGVVKNKVVWQKRVWVMWEVSQEESLKIPAAPPSTASPPRRAKGKSSHAVRIIGLSCLKKDGLDEGFWQNPKRGLDRQYAAPIHRTVTSSPVFLGL